MKIKYSKGFTLIELLIVVAIIAILAAIAIPQFAQYRIRGYNSSAMSDLRNGRTSEEALFADWQRYGISDNTAPYAGSDGGPGTLLLGPTDPTANPTCLTLNDQNGAARGLDIAIGNNVNFTASTDAGTPPAGNGTYTIATKNVAGDTVFGADSDSTQNYRAQDKLWITVPLATSPVPDCPAATVGNIDFGSPFVGM